MAYKKNLKWARKLPEFSEEETKVLLALSHDEYKWRTKKRIAKSTGISPDQVDSVLSGLIEKNKVRLSMSKKKNVIFGLRERVE